MRYLLIAFSIALFLPTIAGAALSAQLSGSPTHTLPGIPVTLTVSIANDDSVKHAIPTMAILIATPAGGQPFIADAHGAVAEDLTLWLLGTASLSPHGTYTFDIPVDATLDHPSWFTDLRLARQGMYRLQLVLTDTSVDKLRAAQPSTLAAFLGDRAVFTNEISLVVNTPTSDDASVWQLVSAANTTRRASFCRQDLARTILTDHPNSTYAQYVSVCVPFDRPTSISNLERAIAANPGGPIADWQQMLLGDLESYMYRDAVSRQLDASVLAAHAQKATSAYRTIVNAGHSTLARFVAQKKLDDLLGMLNEDGTPVH